ncbi:MAG: serine/threonine protein kinase [Candidatus Eremiobacteraeota bacterium]|nr:serine/threonine protein kinase [Candidatus Eremiobacteraeota bacterium]MCW5867265.1 serine/threonine protein kinase [Candidatus Eremiobacteraeota bacterium]
MSNLYIATDLQQGNAVRVIKEMTARYADPNEQKQAENLFMREAQLLATLNHPHIPKVFDKFIFQGKYYLSMEYCQGDDLGKIIQDRGTIEEKMASAWGSQMATVLYYLHRQNPPIVFRDVKPSNIMIVNDQVKLIDFGIARHFTSAKKGDTMRIGSPGYAPPEQYSGQTDPRSDIYALGVTLHHAVTGFDPTISQTPFLIPPARSLNPKVSAEMEALIARATQLDPDKRYDNCLDMKRDLQVVMRNHGLVVGTSVPFSTLNQPGPGATVPKLPPSMAQAAAQAQQQAATTGPATAVTPAPAATPTPSPTPAPPPTVTAAPPPLRKRRGKGGLVMVLLAVGLGVGATQAPANWRTAAGEQFNRLLGQLQFLIPSSAPPLSDAEKSLLLGGPVPAAAEELGRPVRDGKATPEEVLAYQNALVYGSGRPIRRLSVIAPADQKVAATLAAWQRSNWNEASREGTLLVISLENVESDWAGAVRRAMGRERFREGRPADGLLVYPPAQRPNGWAGWFDKSPPLFWVGARAKADPVAAKTLPVPETNYAELLHQMQLSEPIWLAKEPPAPSGSKQESFGGPDTIVKLLKQNPKPLLVVDAEQLKTVENWPKINGGRLLTIVPAGALSEQPPSGIPAGYRLYALSQATPYAADPTVADFFQTPDRNALMFDALSRVGSHMLGETRQTGLTWHSDRNGELEPARFSLLEARNGQWVWLREGGGK